MIISVIVLAEVGDITVASLAGDDSSRATVATSRRRHRILSIVAAGCNGKRFSKFPKMLPSLRG